MPSERDTDGFCKTTLSAMLLNYPPPTAININTAFDSDDEREREVLNSTLHYLSDEKVVQPDDLILIIDSQQTWFQLPSSVIVAQYKRLLENANIRLLKKYGVNDDGYQKYNQTIIFGAEKMCESDDMACRYVPASVLPMDIYGAEAGRRIADVPAQFLNSKVVMGPATDMKTLYQAALEKFDEGRSQAQTVQSVFATLFGEQQLRRDAKPQRQPSPGTRIMQFLTTSKPPASPPQPLQNQNTTRHEFAIGLDYTHTLFQPLTYCTTLELLPLLHTASTNLTAHMHPSSPITHLSLPFALSTSPPPFSRPNLLAHNPSPNTHPAYITPLDFSAALDTLPKRKTSWRKVPLVQNTFTGAVPAVLLAPPPLGMLASQAPSANLTWHDLWFTPYSRALLRNTLRTAQSPTIYHDALLGGDRTWDARGGIGGVWTFPSSTWLPWGEVDGVCGTLSALNEVFGDGKGVWLHEGEDGAEETRVKEEADERERVEKERERDEKRRKEVEEREKEEREKKEKAEAEAEAVAEEVEEGDGEVEKDGETEGEGDTERGGDVEVLERRARRWVA